MDGLDIISITNGGGATIGGVLGYIFTNALSLAGIFALLGIIIGNIVGLGLLKRKK